MEKRVTLAQAWRLMTQKWKVLCLVTLAAVIVAVILFTFLHTGMDSLSQEVEASLEANKDYVGPVAALMISVQDPSLFKQIFLTVFFFWVVFFTVRLFTVRPDSLEGDEQA